MTYKNTGVVIAMTLVMMAPLLTEAQQAAIMPHIGILRPGSPPDPFDEAFRQASRAWLHGGTKHQHRTPLG
jgi:hypothetical protein